MKSKVRTKGVPFRIVRFCKESRNGQTVANAGLLPITVGVAPDPLTSEFCSGLAWQVIDAGAAQKVAKKAFIKCRPNGFVCLHMGKPEEAPSA